MRKFETEIRVIYADTDQMGIVYYANYIKWFEIGRTEYLRAVGFPYRKVEECGIWLPVAEVTCQYKAPARYDDVIVIRTWVKDLGGASITMAYELVNKETGTLLVTGTSKHPTTNPDLKPVALRKIIPELHALIKADMEE